MIKLVSKKQFRRMEERIASLESKLDKLTKRVDRLWDVVLEEHGGTGGGGPSESDT